MAKQQPTRQQALEAMGFHGLLAQETQAHHEAIDHDRIPGIGSVDDLNDEIRLGQEQEEEMLASQFANIGKLSRKMGIDLPDMRGWTRKQASSHLDMLSGRYRETQEGAAPVAPSGNPNTPQTTIMTPDHFLATLKASARPFAATGASHVTYADVPKPESQFIKPADLIGVHFYAIAVDIVDGVYKGEPKKQAVYRILIDQRADLGVRKVGLGSKFALTQAGEFQLKDFPFAGTIATYVEKGWSNPALIMGPCEGPDKKYYHAPEVAQEPDIW